MINSNFKKIINWQFIAVVITLILGLIGFLSFEYSLILKIILIVMITAIGYVCVTRNNIEYLLIFTLFLIINDIYNLYFLLGINLWIVMLLNVFFTTLIIYLRLDKYKEKIGKYLFLVYISLLSIISLEIFLSLIPWPTDPKVKSGLVVSILYLFSNLAVVKISEKLQFKKILLYLIVISIIIFLVTITTKWYGY